MHGEMRRGATVLKMRGSSHEKDIREFTIDGTGMHIGKPFRNISGILSGRFIHRAPEELERVRELFKDDGVQTMNARDVRDAREAVE
jgi:circadian clock protein KaiC